MQWLEGELILLDKLRTCLATFCHPHNFFKHLKRLLLQPCGTCGTFYIEKDAISYILQQNKVSRTAYPYIVKHCAEFPAKCTQAWQATFQDKTFQWQPIFSLVFKITFHTKLQAFQFKFLHGCIIYTNSRLFKIKLVDSPICSFCHNAEETLVHLFCECPVSKSF